MSIASHRVSCWRSILFSTFPLIILENPCFVREGKECCYGYVFLDILHKWWASRFISRELSLNPDLVRSRSYVITRIHADFELITLVENLVCWKEIGASEDTRGERVERSDKSDQPFHVDARLFRGNDKFEFLNARYACIRSRSGYASFPIELPIETQ